VQTGNTQQPNNIEDFEKSKEELFLSLLEDGLADDDHRKKILLGLLDNIKLIGQLNEAKEWLDQQRQNWQRMAIEQQKRADQNQAQLNAANELIDNFRSNSFFRLAHRLGWIKLDSNG
jgi:type IV secretory pathway TraG/TraD family ATPase VirD4